MIQVGVRLRTDVIRLTVTRAIKKVSEILRSNISRMFDFLRVENKSLIHHHPATSPPPLPTQLLVSGATDNLTPTSLVIDLSIQFQSWTCTYFIGGRAIRMIEANG